MSLLQRTQELHEVALLVACDSTPTLFIFRPQRDKVDMEMGDITTKRCKKNVFRCGIVTLSDCFSDLLQSCLKPREDVFVHLFRAVPFTRLSCQNSVALCVRGSRDKSKPPPSFVKNAIWNTSRPETKITFLRMYLLKGA